MVFIDGLKPESIKYMPFLDSLPTKRRIRTEFGYSPTCYASMFGGVYPNKHHVWFSWKYSPDTSPYRWLKKYKMDSLPHNLFTKYACFRLADFMSHGLLPWQGPMPLQWWYVPVSSWHYFDLTTKRAWFELDYLENYPTVFGILTNHGIQYELVGIEKAKPEKLWQSIEQYDFSEIKPWTLFFIGDIDLLSHYHKQNSDIVIERLAEIDRVLREKCELLESKAGDFDFVMFSDHGHVEINDYLDVKSIFKSYGESLDDFIYFIDANFVRFIFRNEDEERRVRDILSHLESVGFILTETHLRKYHLDMPDNRYGNLIFYVEAPHHVTAGLKIGWKKLRSPFVSAHGYSPDNPDSDGVFISSTQA